MNKIIHASIIAIAATACAIPHVDHNVDPAEVAKLNIHVTAFENQALATEYCNSKLGAFDLLISFGANYGCSRYNLLTEVCEIYIAKQLIDSVIYDHELAHCIEAKNAS